MGSETKVPGLPNGARCDAPGKARLPWPLCAGMAAQFAAGGAVVPFVTLYLRDRGLDLGQISLIFVASSATLLVFPLLWGMLADRVIPLNRLFAFLNAGACVALLALALGRTYPALLLAYTCYFACFNPTLYLMNALGFHHLSDPREQFGRLRAWGSLGWIIPFLPIALWLRLSGGRDLEFVLYVGMGCSLVMVALTFWLPHTPPGARASAANQKAGSAYGPAIRRLLRDPDYLVVLVSMFLIAGSFSLLTYYSPALLEDSGIARVWIGPVQAIAVVSEIVLFQWQPHLLKRWNYAAVIIAGCVALSLRHLVFGMAESAWVLCASYVLAGVVIVFYHQGVSILVNTIAAKEIRATAQTLLLLVGQGMGPLFANLLTGKLATQTADNLRPVFFFAAVLAGLAGVVLAIRGRRLNDAGRAQVRAGIVT
ncbi:MAG: MFS transporter [Verrucomicrobiia bacterium]